MGTVCPHLAHHIRYKIQIVVEQVSNGVHVACSTVMTVKTSPKPGTGSAAAPNPTTSPGTPANAALMRWC